MFPVRSLPTASGLPDWLAPDHLTVYWRVAVAFGDYYHESASPFTSLYRPLSYLGQCDYRRAAVVTGCRPSPYKTGQGGMDKRQNGVPGREHCHTDGAGISV